jgi:hypothetical protein
MLMREHDRKGARRPVFMEKDAPVRGFLPASRDWSFAGARQHSIWANNGGAGGNNAPTDSLRILISETRRYSVRAAEW